MSGKAEAVFLPPQLSSSHRLLWAMLMVSFAAHAALAVAFFHVWSPLRVGTDENPHIISVALVAAPQKVEPKPKVEVPRSPVALPKPKEPPVKKKILPIQTGKVPQVVAVGSASAERVLKPASTVPEAASIDGVAVLSSAALETRAQGRAAYGRLVWTKIAEAKPAGLHRMGSVDMRFSITSEGALGSVEVLRSSGNVELEALARDTLARAAPFPPPPSDLTQADLIFEIPFNFR